MLCAKTKEDFFVKENQKTALRIYARRMLLVVLDAAMIAFSFYFALLLRAEGASNEEVWYFA